MKKFLVLLFFSLVSFSAQAQLPKAFLQHYLLKQDFDQEAFIVAMQEQGYDLAEFQKLVLLALLNNLKNFEGREKFIEQLEKSKHLSRRIAMTLKNLRENTFPYTLSPEALNNFVDVGNGYCNRFLGISDATPLLHNLFGINFVMNLDGQGLHGSYVGSVNFGPIEKMDPPTVHHFP